VHLDFIRLGRPVKNGYINLYYSKLCDECMNKQVFFNLAEAWRSYITVVRLEPPWPTLGTGPLHPSEVPRYVCRTSRLPLRSLVLATVCASLSVGPTQTESL